MSGPSDSITPRCGRPLVFDVIVRGDLDESRHQVAITADEAERWAEIGAQPALCVEAMMRFLLDRESKESILNAFDMNVVRRYFPEFDAAFPGTLPASAANQEATRSRRLEHGRDAA